MSTTPVHRGSSGTDSLPSAQPWHHRHILDIDGFTAAEIERVFEVSDAMKEVLSREIKKVPTLRGKTVVTLFYESSTRTRAGFELAAKNLSADVVNISATGSSVDKGESLRDTVRTLEALGADAIVLRHQSSGAPYFVACHSSCSVINAGDGWHAHPTQALLDLYTVRSHLGKLTGLKAVIIGDILHSRVARSNIWGMHTMGMKLVLCGPPTLLPRYWSQEHLPPVTFETDLERALENADVIMALRLQLERQQSGLLPSLREYIQLYQLNEERLAKAKPSALVLHPGPMNEGIEISPEVAHGTQAVVEEQVANGVAVRMALLYLLLTRGEEK